MILSTFSSDILLILWLIYGNMLFYSDRNDCDKREGTKFEFYLMFVFLLFGYFIMAMYALILLMVPIVLIMVWRERNLPREDGRIVPERSTQKVLDSLKVLKFSNLGSLEQGTCSICFEEFKDTDEITPLNCHESHFFHTGCLKEWVKNRHNSCPICRELITQDI